MFVWKRNGFRCLTGLLLTVLLCACAQAALAGTLVLAIFAVLLLMKKRRAAN